MFSKLNVRMGWMSAVFFVFPFTYFLQVVFRNELLGAIPYLLMAFTIPKAAKQWRMDMQAGRVWLSGDLIDVMMIALVLVSTAHIVMGYLIGDVDLGNTLRCLLIYVVSCWAYIYFRNVAELAESRGVLLAITCAAIIIGLHWIYDTYMKMVMHDPGSFAWMSYEYIKYRNGFADGQVNMSVLWTNYRSYGMLDKHTTTGAIVAIGGLAMLGLLSTAKRLVTSLIAISFFFGVLSIGMATTAWVSFILIVPIVMFLTAPSGKRLIGAVSVIVCFAGVHYIGGTILSQSVSGKALVRNIVMTIDAQKSHVMNIENSGVAEETSAGVAEETSAGVAEETSYINIYLREAEALSNYLKSHPLYIFLGEGFLGYSGVLYPRGGDVAFSELLTTYGILMSLLLLATIIASLRRVRVEIFSPNSVPESRYLLVFAGAVLCFLLLSLVHYNTFFNKSIFILLPMSLGIIRRYATLSNAVILTDRNGATSMRA